jgi:hypothetical protein
MTRFLTLIACATFANQAHAAPCQFSGDVPGFVFCIADQASAAWDNTSYQWQNNDDNLVWVDKSPSYHLSIAADRGYENRSRAIPIDVIDALCGDADGCSFRLAMTKWASDSDTAAAHRAGTLYYSSTDGRWRNGWDSTSISGDGVTTHILNAGDWDTCYLTDTEYENRTNLGDNDRGLHLLLWDGYSNSTRACHLTIND